MYINPMSRIITPVDENQLSHVTEKTETPTAPTSEQLYPTVPIPADYQVIKFYDNHQEYAKLDWIKQYPALAQPIIFRRSQLYKKYIFPLLNGESIRWDDNVDCKQEAGQLLEEIHHYGIELTPKQTQELADASGLSLLITTVKQYILDHSDGFFTKRKFAKQITAFASQWDKYLEIQATKYNNPILKEITTSFLYETFMSNDYYSLIILNTRYSNLIFEFVSWFKTCIIENNGEKFSKFQVELGLQLNLSDASSGTPMSSSGGLSITSLLSQFTGNTIDKNTFLKKMANLDQMKKLLG